MDATARHPIPGAGTMLSRTLRRRCPLCGAGGIFRGWFELRDRCPDCGFSFEREEGYWTGALIVNIGGAQILFFAVFLGGLAVTWPDVPWLALLLAGLAVMATFPIVFYPYSKTLWLWGDLTIRGRTSDWTDGDRS